MPNKIQKGKKGEEIAEQYLMNNGYKIRETNWRSGRFEIDIIAEKDNILIIIEVKTRKNRQYQNPEEAVNNYKQRHIIKATEKYINEYQIDIDIRFDIISVILNDKKCTIDHIVDAFNPL